MLGGFPALSHAHVSPREPRTTLLTDAFDDGQVQQVAAPRNAFVEHDVELGLLEWRGDLVLDHLAAHVVANGLVAIFDGTNTPNINTNRRIELQGSTTGGGFRRTKHHADLLTDLVDENHRAIASVDRTGQLSHGLTHQAGLQTNVGIAHFTFNFRFGNEGGHRVHHNHVGGIRTHQQFADLKRLLTGIRLGDQHLFNVDTDTPCPCGIQRMFGINERHHTASLLGFGRNGQSKRGLTTGFWPEHFNDAPLGHTSTTQGQVQAQGARPDSGRCGEAIPLEAHDRTFAVRLLNLGEGPIQRGLATGGLCVRGGSGVFFACCHG